MLRRQRAEQSLLRAHLSPALLQTLLQALLQALLPAPPASPRMHLPMRVPLRARLQLTVNPQYTKRSALFPDMEKARKFPLVFCFSL